jgi:hypothetical protein
LLPERWYWVSAAALVAVGGGWWLRTWLRGRATAGDEARWPMAWNGILCGLVLVLCVVSDAMVLQKLEASAAGAAAFVLVRTLTQIVLVALAWWALHLFLLWTPRGLRWLGGLMTGGALLLLLAEIGMNQLWGKGLTMFFGEFAAGDKFDLVRVMEGGNVKLGISGVLLVVGAVLTVSGAVWLTRWLSARAGLRLRPRTLFAAALGAWLVLLVEQGTESWWLDRPSHWLQRRALLVHLSPYQAQPGWAGFRVAFRDAPRPTGAGATRKPDIHLFVVETLRSDALRPEIAPFLCTWRDTECQPLKHSYSASNATHLSWFAALSGRPPVFWEQGRQAQRPAPLFEFLRDAGYRNEVRSSSFFDYVEMDTTNFGHGEATDEILTLRDHPETWPQGTSERDLRVLELWKQSVLARPAGGVCRVMAVESPHYPFYWPAGFAAPHTEFFTSKVFPFKPSEHNVRLIRNRYDNSVAFVDSLLRRYLEFLKEQGKYDDAMIIVTGDHGEELQERGFWFHASALTREQTGVPVLIKWPRAMGRGEAAEQGGHLDLVPSVLDALGCPESQWAAMAGRSLHRGGDHTVLVTSHYASQNGEGMHWRRGDYEAAFSWHEIWVPGVPERIWLDRFTGPDGPQRFATPQAAEAALRKHFPDAFDRWFTRFEREPDE